MLDSTTKKDIEAISMDILKESKSYGVFPTPVDKIVQCAELKIGGGIDLESIRKKSSGFNITEVLKSAVSKVRGILDRSEKVIYLDLTQIDSRKAFVTLHETGHSVLPWQGEILQYVDDDNTLDLATQEDFEAEANFFASATLFQNDLFNQESKKLELGVSAPLYLSKKFGASGHAALRRYVELHKSRCSLLVLEPSKNIPKGANLRNHFYSQSFIKEYGGLSWPATFDFKWPFMLDLVMNKKLKTNGTLTVPTSNGEMVEFGYEYFNNTYNVFVMIFPKGEKKKTKVTIHVN